MKRFLRISLALVIALVPSMVSAARYECTVRRIDFPDEDPAGVRDFFSGGLIGHSFSVDTRDGVMTGILSNSLYKPPVVFNHGDSENSFVSATIVSPKFDAGVVGVDTRILTIKTWRDGGDKPFSLFWDDKLLRGVCVER